MRSRRLDQRRWLTAITILTLGFGSIWQFHRNFHFQFDSHHQYDDATFFQWIAGWFAGFDRGPLTASIVEGPKVAKSNFKPSTYRWYLKKRFPKAEIVAWLEDSSGMRFSVVQLSNPREFLIHCWSDGRWPRLKFDLTAHHVGNQREWVETKSSLEGVRSFKALSATAWQVTRLEFSEESWSGPLIGRKITLPGSETIKDWTFHIEANSKDKNGDRFLADFVIGFDSTTQAWRIYDREWHEIEGINSWIDRDKLLELPSLPPGFAP